MWGADVGGDGDDTGQKCRGYTERLRGDHMGRPYGETTRGDNVVSGCGDPVRGADIGSQWSNAPPDNDDDSNALVRKEGGEWRP